LRLADNHLTPAADIYSLAKTTYTLLAGESPRRFAQHALSQLPEQIRDEPWANSVLRVLEKATQNRPDQRYQTVEEFWDEIADASLPPTRPLRMVSPEMQLVRRKPSEDLSVQPEEEFTEAAPPRPHFEVPHQREPEIDTIKRPRIVVPISP
jgi:serine/threonine protein kinase